MKGVVVIEGPAAPTGKSWAPPVPALAPVVNRPLVLRAVETLARAGADEVVVVADRQALPRLRSSLASGAGHLPVSWLAAEEEPTVAGALLQAAPLVTGHRLVVHTTSGLWLRGQGALVQALATSDLDALLFCRDRSAATAPAPAGLATAAEPPPPSLLRFDDGTGAAHSGVFSFSPAILDALREATADGSDPDLLDAVDVLLRDGGRVEAALAEGWWQYSGEPEELLDANYLALDELPAAQGVHHATESRVDGRVQIHPTARVHRSIVRGPALIGAHATVVDAYIGPYTAVGDAATVENAEVEGSILLTGCRVHDVGARLEGSIIGPGAHVARGFELPKAIRLLVGEDARVTLA